ncbi:unnamed protein product [Zymoseptoria tritici ST99CH_3D1]|nr:unnamed protein product [Zymoseptoria tritici ST99CH_3D1]
MTTNNARADFNIKGRTASNQQGWEPTAQVKYPKFSQASRAVLSPYIKTSVKISMMVFGEMYSDAVVLTGQTNMAFDAEVLSADQSLKSRNPSPSISSIGKEDSTATLEERGFFSSMLAKLKAAQAAKAAGQPSAPPPLVCNAGSMKLTPILKTKVGASFDGKPVDLFSKDYQFGAQCIGGLPVGAAPQTTTTPTFSSTSTDSPLSTGVTAVNSPTYTEWCDPPMPVEHHQNGVITTYRGCSGVLVEYNEGDGSVLDIGSLGGCADACSDSCKGFNYLQADGKKKCEIITKIRGISRGAWAGYAYQKFSTRPEDEDQTSTTPAFTTDPSTSTTMLPSPTTATPVENGMTTTAPDASAPTTCDNQGIDWTFYDDGANGNFDRLDLDSMRSFNRYSASGVDTTLGGYVTGDDWDQQFSVYGISNYNQDFSVKHTGWIWAQTTGAYVFDMGKPDDVSLLWVGDKALHDWTESNAELRSAFFDSQPKTYIAHLNAGQYYPFRIVYKQYGGPGSFDHATITDPRGNVILSQDSVSSPYLVRYSCDRTTAPRMVDFPEITPQDGSTTTTSPALGDSTITSSATVAGDPTTQTSEPSRTTTGLDSGYTPGTCQNEGLDWTVYTNQMQPDLNLEAMRDYSGRSYGVTSALGGFFRQDGFIQAYREFLPPTAIGIKHLGYIYARVSGEYVFNFGIPDDRAMLWIGDKAVSGWDESNADIDAKLGDESPKEFRKQLTKGQYYPIRIVWAQGDGDADFKPAILDPQGNILLSAKSDTSPFVVRYSCNGSAPPIKL